MKRIAMITGLAALSLGAGVTLAQTEDGFTYVPNRITYEGVLQGGESCVFDPERNLILSVNGGPGGAGVSNGFVALIHPDGTVHTPRWIDGLEDDVTLVNTLGSAIQGGVLYIADNAGGETGSVVRKFDLDTGAQLETIPVPGATFLNGIGVDQGGNIYLSNSTGNMRILKVTPDGEVSVLVQGAGGAEPVENPTIVTPNGVAVDPDGNVVVVNIGDNRVLTYDPVSGELLRTETAAQAGNDGLVILPNGIKYTSKVTGGGGSVSVIRPGESAVEIAGAPETNAGASACYDSIQHQLVIPVTSAGGGGANAYSALIFLPLDPADRPAPADSQ